MGEEFSVVINWKKIWKLLCFNLLLLVSISCGPGSSQKPVIETLTVLQSDVKLGEVLELNWKVANADSCNLNINYFQKDTLSTTVPLPAVSCTANKGQIIPSSARFSVTLSVQKGSEKDEKTTEILVLEPMLIAKASNWSFNASTLRLFSLNGKGSQIPLTQASISSDGNFELELPPSPPLGNTFAFSELGACAKDVKVSKPTKLSILSSIAVDNPPGQLVFSSEQGKYATWIHSSEASTIKGPSTCSSVAENFDLALLPGWNMVLVQQTFQTGVLSKISYQSGQNVPTDSKWNYLADNTPLSYFVGAWNLDYTVTDEGTVSGSTHFVSVKTAPSAPLVLSLANPSFNQDLNLATGNFWQVFYDSTTALDGSYQACTTLTGSETCVSNTFSQTNALAKPSNLKANYSGEILTLTWNAVSGAFGYLIEVIDLDTDTSLTLEDAMVTGTVASYELALDAAKSYAAHVIAVGWDNEAERTSLYPPSSPRNFNASGISAPVESITGPVINSLTPVLAGNTAPLYSEGNYIMANQDTVTLTWSVPDPDASLRVFGEGEGVTIGKNIAQGETTFTTPLPTTMKFTLTAVKGDVSSSKAITVYDISASFSEENSVDLDGDKARTVFDITASDLTDTSPELQCKYIWDDNSSDTIIACPNIPSTQTHDYAYDQGTVFNPELQILTPSNVEISSMQTTVDLSDIEPGEPGILSFTATPAQIPEEESVSLAWTVVNSTNHTCKLLRGSVILVESINCNSSTTDTPPEGTYIYTLQVLKGTEVKIFDEETVKVINKQLNSGGVNYEMDCSSCPDSIEPTAIHSCYSCHELGKTSAKSFKTKDGNNNFIYSEQRIIDRVKKDSSSMKYPSISGIVIDNFSADVAKYIVTCVQSTNPNCP